MGLLNYIIADDEPVYLTLIEQIVGSATDVRCLKVCSNALEVHQFLQTHPVDFLILDVEMPGLSGIQLVKSLREIPFIIFISSHANYAADAFEVDAIDFIKKPIPPERLLRAIDKVKQLKKIKEAMANIESFKQEDADSFFIREDNAYVRIKFDEVLYIESMTDFVKIHLLDGKEKLALVNLKNIEQQIPAAIFIRISRSHIVNKSHVTLLGNGFLQLGKIQLGIGAIYTEAVTKVIVGNQAIKRYI